MVKCIKHRISPPEVFYKKVLLEISQNSQENIYDGDSSVSNIWSSIQEKVQQHEAELKKSVAYKKSVYLILVTVKKLQFKKYKPMLQGIFSPPRKSNWIQVLPKYFSNYLYLKIMYENLKKIGKIQCVSKLLILLNLWISELHRS